MNKYKIIIYSVVFICIASLGFLFAAKSFGNDDNIGREYFEREDQHSFPLFQEDNEGNETAGQIAVWLLVIANMPVMLSILIKRTNKLFSNDKMIKITLSNVNHFQKKHLMFLHYYLNPAILLVVLWHYFSSRCNSTSLPEFGMLLMFFLVSLGIVIKYRLSPKYLRKNLIKIHCHPIVLVVMVVFLSIGHLIVD